MKILQVSNYYYPFIGGIEQVARDCSDALKDHHEVKVFCFHKEKGDMRGEVDGVDASADHNGYQCCRNGQYF